MITRRSLIRGMGALLAAPAIVRASSLMPVRGLPVPSFFPDMGVAIVFTGDSSPGLLANVQESDDGLAWRICQQLRRGQHYAAISNPARFYRVVWLPETGNG